MAQRLRKGSSLPPLTKRLNSYIEHTMQLLDSGCQQGDSLKIDGYYGDYRMRLFRLKDKNAYSKNINSVFTNTFTKSIIPLEDTAVREQIQQIIHSDRHKQQYLREKSERQNLKNQPVYNKGNIISTMQEDQHLFYAYIPEYQKNRWFQVKDSSRREVQTLQPKSENNKLKKASLKRKKNKYMFAYLQKAHSQRQQ